MYSARLIAGFEWAARLHAAQMRKGVETPYFSHLLGVASLAIEYGGDEDAVIAALLHDSVEDCGGLPMLDQIRSMFGDAVANIVGECSDSAGAPGADKTPWLARKAAYVAAVAMKSDRACFVTACDKLHNASAILADHRLDSEHGGDTVWDRFGGKPREQTVAYYSAMVAALKGRVPVRLWQRLAATVAELEAAADPVEHARWVRALAAA